MTGMAGDRDVAGGEGTTARMRAERRWRGEECRQSEAGITTAEYAVGHLTARLTAIEHSYGGTRELLGVLAGRVAGYERVDVLA